jgi:hypothetical protein
MKARAAVVLVIALAAGPACRSTADLLVRVDLPGVSPLAPGSFDEVVVADFREESPRPDFRAGRELREYLAAEIDLAFRGTITRIDTSEEALSGSRARVLVLAGSIRMTTEVRKALDMKNSTRRPVQARRPRPRRGPSLDDDDRPVRPVGRRRRDALSPDLRRRARLHRSREAR